MPIRVGPPKAREKEKEERKGKGGKGKGGKAKGKGIGSKGKGKGKGYHNHLNYYNPVDRAWQDDESQWWLAQYYEDDSWSNWES